MSKAPGTRTISICFSADAVALQRIERAAHQRLDDEVVEARGDERSADRAPCSSPSIIFGGHWHSRSLAQLARV